MQGRAFALAFGIVAAVAAAGIAAETAPLRPVPRPEMPPAPLAETAPEAALAPEAEAPAVRSSSGRPVPRFASLKAREGNARRGPHYDHRIDWVFVRPGMPLLITAEHEHWRRVEDSEGAGGWVHYSLLSVARTVQVVEDMADIRARPEARAPVIARAERGAIARVTACQPEWCRISRDGVRGWVPKGALWGVTSGETFD